MNTRLTLRKQEFLNPSTGKILLVGDKPGPGIINEPEGYIPVPFNGYKHSSLWLNRLLDKHNIPEEKLTWINAFYLEGQPSQKEEYYKRQPRAVIGLGIIAQNWLKNVGCKDFYCMDHPQFWKRFKSKQFYPLITLLENLTY
ncbi:MAG: hypothetical protein QXN55_01700 [Candidatus Nitrosotenuis sp.]